jgi:hypothetical protein
MEHATFKLVTQCVNQLRCRVPLFNGRGFFSFCQKYVWSEFSFFIVSWGWVRLSPPGTSANNWPIVPAPVDRAVGGMRIGKGKRSTRRKPVPVTLCPPQTTRDVTWARTMRLTAWAVARPLKSELLTTIRMKITDLWAATLFHFKTIHLNFPSNIWPLPFYGSKSKSCFLIIAFPFPPFPYSSALKTDRRGVLA